jgi:hypothetical protein
LPDNTGGAIVVGYVEGQAGEVDRDMYLLKLGSDGEEQWCRIYKEEGDNIGYSAVKTISSDIVVVGRSVSSRSAVVGVVFRAEEKGEKRWQQGVASGRPAVPVSVANGPDDTVVVSGWLENFEGNNRGFLSRVDGFGNELWCYVLQDEGFSRLYDAQFLENQEIVAVGYESNRPVGVPTLLVVRVDCQGGLVRKTVVNDGPESIGRRVFEMQAGGVYVCGEFGGYCHLWKADRSDRLEPASRALFATDDFESLDGAPLANGSIVVTGRAITDDHSDGIVALVSRRDDVGVESLLLCGGRGYDSAYCVSVGEGDAIWAAGAMQQGEGVFKCCVLVVRAECVFRKLPGRRRME